MSDKRTVWAVASGSYSDYQVHFLCATKAQVTDYIESHKEEFPSLYEERFDLYEKDLPECQWKYTVVANLTDDGKWEIESEDRNICPHDYEYPPPKRPYVHYGDRRRKGQHRRIIAVCADKDAALKAVSDRIAWLNQEEQE